MIGQQALLNQIDWMCKAGCFPRFSIIVGVRGSEKLEIAKYIAKQLQAITYTTPDNKIDRVRDIIEEAYKITHTMVYIINDADDMSIPAKNALLKVTEEPPNNAYFIMTLEDANNTLDTIKSRAVILTMEPYSRDNLLGYAMDVFGAQKLDGDLRDIITSLCATPGDIDLLNTMNPFEFYSYVEKVVDNINTPNGANAFKIAEKVALKDETDKYDLTMFWRACCKSFGYRARIHLHSAVESDTVLYVGYLAAVKATSAALKKLSIRGVNKQMLFDEWLLKVREVLR